MMFPAFIFYPFQIWLLDWYAGNLLSTFNQFIIFVVFFIFLHFQYTIFFFDILFPIFLSKWFSAGGPSLRTPHKYIYIYDLYDVLPFLGNRMLLHSFIYPSFPTMKANMEYKFERRNVNDEEIALQKNRERDLSNQLLGCRKTKNKFFSFFFNVYIRTCTYMYVVWPYII